MLLVRTTLAPSPIEGLGVYAAEFIPAGKKFWEFTPRFDICLDKADLEALSDHMRDYVARYSYPHLKRKGVVVLDADNGKYMNHADRPNTDFTCFETGIALADIAIGEEITCNYAEFDPDFAGGFVVRVKEPRLADRRRKLAEIMARASASLKRASGPRRGGFRGPGRITPFRQYDGT